jgi:hypothetical protein
MAVQYHIPYRNAFVGNYHFTYLSIDTQRFDMSITIPSNSYGNFIVIPWEGQGSVAGGTYSTTDSTCILNDPCTAMGTGYEGGFIRNDTLYMEVLDAGSQFAYQRGIGIKY